MAKKSTPKPESDDEAPSGIGLAIAIPDAQTEAAEATPDQAGDEAGDQAVDRPDSGLPEDFLETVLPPTSSYKPRYISQVIGVPLRIIDAARNAGDLGAPDQAHVNIESAIIQGGELIAWIRRQAVAWNATNDGWGLYHREKRAQERRARKAREGAEAKPVPTIVDCAEEALAERTHRAEQEADRERLHEAADYRRLLLADSPEPADVERLADMIEARGLDVQQVRNDMEFLRDTAQIQSLWDARDALEADLQRATEAFRTAKRERALRHLTAGGDLDNLPYEFQERSNMEKVQRLLADAQGQAVKLKRFARARPEFFDTTTDPPRLLQ